jgi:hypothetical protein
MAITPRARPTQLIGVVGIACDGSGRRSSAIGSARLLGPGLRDGGRPIADRRLLRLYGGKELVASARVINPESGRVLEKCGFSHVGSGLESFPARGGLLPVDKYRLDRRKWQSLKTWSSSDYVPHGPDEPLMAAAAH